MFAPESGPSILPSSRLEISIHVKTFGKPLCLTYPPLSGETSLIMQQHPEKVKANDSVSLARFEEAVLNTFGDRDRLNSTPSMVYQGLDTFTFIWDSQ